MNKKIVDINNYKIGDKVVRGRDWQWGNQDEDSVYGIIKEKYDDYDYVEIFWIKIKWVNHKGIITNENKYRLGPTSFDLYFYEQ